MKEKELKGYSFEDNNKVYNYWKQNSFFRNANSKKKKTMILPPPNITGKLHLGHAWDVFILILWKDIEPLKVITLVDYQEWIMQELQLKQR